MGIVLNKASDDESLPDLLDQLGVDGHEAPDDALLRVLGFEPCGLDALQARCGLDLPTLQARLLELEFDGWVARLPGGVYPRRAHS